MNKALLIEGKYIPLHRLRKMVKEDLSRCVE